MRPPGRGLAIHGLRDEAAFDPAAAELSFLRVGLRLITSVKRGGAVAAHRSRRGGRSGSGRLQHRLRRRGRLGHRHGHWRHRVSWRWAARQRWIGQDLFGRHRGQRVGRAVGALFRPGTPAGAVIAVAQRRFVAAREPLAAGSLPCVIRMAAGNSGQCGQRPRDGKQPQISVPVMLHDRDSCFDLGQNRAGSRGPCATTGCHRRRSCLDFRRL